MSIFDKIQSFFKKDKTKLLNAGTAKKESIRRKIEESEISNRDKYIIKIPDLYKLEEEKKQADIIDITTSAENNSASYFVMYMEPDQKENLGSFFPIAKIKQTRKDEQTLKEKQEDLKKHMQQYLKEAKIQPKTDLANHYEEFFGQKACNLRGIELTPECKQIFGNSHMSDEIEVEKQTDISIPLDRIATIKETLNQERKEHAKKLENDRLKYELSQKIQKTEKLEPKELKAILGMNENAEDSLSDIDIIRKLKNVDLKKTAQNSEVVLFTSMIREVGNNHKKDLAKAMNSADGTREKIDIILDHNTPPYIPSHRKALFQYKKCNEKINQEKDEVKKLKLQKEKEMFLLQYLKNCIGSYVESKKEVVSEYNKGAITTGAPIIDIEPYILHEKKQVER